MKLLFDIEQLDYIKRSAKSANVTLLEDLKIKSQKSLEYVYEIAHYVQSSVVSTNAIFEFLCVQYDANI